MSYSYRGSAKEATTLKVSESLTIPQLQEECKFRGIRGFSGKNKEWLLDELGYGTVWQVMRPNAPKQGAQKAARGPNATKTKAKIAKKTQFTKQRVTPSVAKATSLKGARIQKLPKVSASMTVAQLMHELLHRQPSAKGTSNKPKSWFLEKLGEGSIWSTSAEASALGETNLPVVSPHLTTSQLTHEIMSRSAQHPKGLSSKSKAALLQLVGVGSIWTTGIDGAVKLPAAKKKAATSTPAEKKRSTKSKSKSVRISKMPGSSVSSLTLLSSDPGVPFDSDHCILSENATKTHRSRRT